MNLIPYRIAIDLTDLNRERQQGKNVSPGIYDLLANTVKKATSDINNPFNNPLSNALLNTFNNASLPLKATMVGGPLVGGAVYLASHFLGETASEVQITSARDLDAYVPHPGQGPLVNGLYVGHPLLAKRLLRADVFHKLLEREQVTEIIRFARSQIALRSISVVHRRGKAGKVSAGASVEGVPVSGSASAAFEDITVLSANYDLPERISLDEPLIWRDTYQELAYALQDAKGGGSARLLLSHTGSFSASAEAAGSFKAQLAYLNDRCLEVEIAFA